MKAYYNCIGISNLFVFMLAHEHITALLSAAWFATNLHAGYIIHLRQ